MNTESLKLGIPVHFYVLVGQNLCCTRSLTVYTQKNYPKLWHAPHAVCLESKLVIYIIINVYRLSKMLIAITHGY